MHSLPSWKRRGGLLGFFASATKNKKKKEGMTIQRRSQRGMTYLDCVGFSAGIAGAATEIVDEKYLFNASRSDDFRAMVRRLLGIIISKTLNILIPLFFQLHGATSLDFVCFPAIFFFK